MGRIDSEGVKHPHGVVGHVTQGVRRLDPIPFQGSEQGGDQVAGRLVVEPGGKADVSVVEADHPVAPIGQPTTEVVSPDRHLGPEAGDQQDRWVARIAELLHLDADLVGLDLDHPYSSLSDRRSAGCHDGRLALATDQH